MTQDLYHYTGCGLDWVFLANGYTRHETNYGSGVAIEKLDDLHRANAKEIISRPEPIAGQDVRFLRSFLQLGQANLGRLLGGSKGSPRDRIAKWEADRDKAIPGTADRFLRLFIAGKMTDDKLVKEIVETFEQIDELEHGHRSVFTEDAFGWTTKRPRDGPCTTAPNARAALTGGPSCF